MKLKIFLFFILTCFTFASVSGEGDNAYASAYTLNENTGSFVSLCYITLDTLTNKFINMRFKKNCNFLCSLGLNIFFFKGSISSIRQEYSAPRRACLRFKFVAGNWKCDTSTKSYANYINYFWIWIKVEFEMLVYSIEKKEICSNLNDSFLWFLQPVNGVSFESRVLLRINKIYFFPFNYFRYQTCYLNNLT
jgi:hypothetical protein